MPDPQRQLGFEQLGMGSVLSRNTLLVPPNQREYSWTIEREVKAFFQDLKKAIADNVSEYFLGTIVTIPAKPGVLELVDGQQRLATTAILLAAFRDALKERDADKLIVERIEHTFLSIIDPQARERVARLRLNVTDATFFEGRVLKSDGSAEQTAKSHRLIDEASRMASQYTAEILKGYNEKDYGDILNSWVEFIEHRAIVILLKVPSNVNAYKMFETLNDRGLRTSQSDLVKNYLFGECGDRLPEAQQKWASMKSVLESLEDEDITISFLRQILISFYGYLREPDVYEMVQTRARGVTSSLTFLRKLELGASDYVAILSRDHEKWNAYPTTTRRAIQTLILLRLKPIRPLILSIVREFDFKEADRALRMLVNLTVRFLIVGGARSGAGEQAFSAAAKEASDGKLKTAHGLSGALSKVIPPDAAFEENFKVATVSQAYLARYYLRSLEMTVKGEENPYFEPNDDQEVINLEHVLPKNPEANWPQFTPEIAEVFHKRLGNMALLLAKSNSDLHSAAFTEKKKMYGQSGYELTRQIAEVGDWTPESIAKRQATLAALAVKTWRL